MAEAFRDRLARLRREGPAPRGLQRAAAAAAPPSAARAPGSDGDTLARGDAQSECVAPDRALTEPLERTRAAERAAQRGPSDQVTSEQGPSERESLPSPAALPSSRARAGMPAWLRRHMERERTPARGARATGARAGAWGVASAPEPASLHPVSSGAPRALECSRGALGDVFARRTPLARDHRHGEWKLDEVRAARASDFHLLTGDAALADFELERAVYLDTETTGLSGGAGVYVYMVGLGRFEDSGGFEVWQSFLPGPASEAAMLAEVAERIACASGVVSFFGKSFDRHRLEDKMRIHGIESPFGGLPHLDLYHPLAKLTQGRFPDGRLATMESRLVGLQRASDLPGALAPAAWFDFLADRPHRLEGVFQHNLDDVLSLVTLAAFLGRVTSDERACGGALAGPAGARARAMARAYLARGDRASALRYFELALQDEEASSEERRALAFERAESLRLLGLLEQARAELRALSEGAADAVAVEASIALAKLCEHRDKDPVAALAACLRAAQILAAEHAPRLARARVADLERRSERLQQRIERALDV